MNEIAAQLIGTSNSPHQGLWALGCYGERDGVDKRRCRPRVAGHLAIQLPSRGVPADGVNPGPEAVVRRRVGSPS